MKKPTKKQIALFLLLAALMAALAIIRYASLSTLDLLLRECLLALGFLAALSDGTTRLIPNKLVLGMAGCWVLLFMPHLLLHTAATVPALIDSLVGAVMGGVVFLTVYLASRHGLGGGDVKFMTAAGLYLGLSGVMPTMLVGSVLAALWGGFLILTKRMDKKGAIPLVPFLYVGIVLTSFFG